MNFEKILRMGILGLFGLERKRRERERGESATCVRERGIGHLRERERGGGESTTCVRERGKKKEERERERNWDCV